jgi:uncharacterized protein (TIGR00297 family)
VIDSERLLTAVGVNAVVALSAFFAGTVGKSGVVAGLVVGSLIFLGVGWPGYCVLLAFFVIASGLSKLGYRRKAAIGVAQEAGGRRGAKHAAANCGFAVLLAIMVVVLGGDHAAVPYLLVAYLGAFATALSDTTGSEFGQLYGKTPFLITTFKRVPVGTDGAVSVEGTVAGIAASAIIAAFGFWLMPASFGGGAFFAVVLGAFVGTTAESYIGATIEGVKNIDNEVVNFANTVIGGAATAGLFAVLRG